jgi:hypothetical protein
MSQWQRRGFSDERLAEDRSHEAPLLSPMAACMQGARCTQNRARERAALRFARVEEKHKEK